MATDWHQRWVIEVVLSTRRNRRGLRDSLDDQEYKDGDEESFANKRGAQVNKSNNSNGTMLGAGDGEGDLGQEDQDDEEDPFGQFNNGGGDQSMAPPDDEDEVVNVKARRNKKKPKVTYDDDKNSDGDENDDFYAEQFGMGSGGDQSMAPEEEDGGQEEHGRENGKRKKRKPKKHLWKNKVRQSKFKEAPQKQGELLTQMEAGICLVSLVKLVGMNRYHHCCLVRKVSEKWQKQ